MEAWIFGVTTEMEQKKNRRKKHLVYFSINSRRKNWIHTRIENIYYLHTHFINARQTNHNAVYIFQLMVAPTHICMNALSEIWGNIFHVMIYFPLQSSIALFTNESFSVYKLQCDVSGVQRTQGQQKKKSQA